MTRQTPVIRLFATDIDDTILGDPVAARRFKLMWESLDPEHRPLLVFNSGRSVSDVQWLVLEKHLPAAEFIIGGIGTELHDPLDTQAALEFATSILTDWDSAAVRRMVDNTTGAQPQPPDFLNPYKLSWHWHGASEDEVSRLELRLRTVALDLTVLYTSGIFLDVLPRRAGKGNALAWLCRRIGASLENVLVAGASANNQSMFALPGVAGMVIGNASQELFDVVVQNQSFVTSEKMANGVLASLEYFGVGQAAGCFAAGHAGEVSHGAW